MHKPTMGLLVLMFLFPIGLSTGIAKTNYSAVYINWKNAYKTTIDEPKYCASCLNSAETKGKSFNSYTQEEQEAVAIVNMYTQEGPKIYSNLNKQLRCGTLTPVMRLYKDLLNSAIDMLSPKDNFSNKTVYRGTKRCDNLGLGEYKFAGFTSTTTNPNIAFSFGFANGVCGIYIVIKQAEGLFVKSYSTFAGEDEVILKSGTIIHVNKFLKNKTDIQKEMENIWPNFASSASVKIFVEGEYIGGSTRRRKKRSTKIIDGCAVSGLQRLDIDFSCFFASVLFLYCAFN